MAGTVLVTGGTGFIGRALVATLAAEGSRVRCLVRDGRPVAGAEVVVGDVTRPESLTSALRGVGVVYHLAGATVVRHPLEYRRTNAIGTRHLAEACAAMASPPLVVYLSSLAAAGPAVQGRPRGEDDAPAPVSQYGRSKLAGERELARLAGRVPATVVRAASTFGPGDPNALRLFKAAQAGVNGVPGTADVRLAMIYVDDLVRLLPLAARHGARLDGNGRRGVYFAAMDRAETMGELGRLAGEAVGRARVRTFGLPPRFCRFWGRVIDVAVAVSGQPRLLTSDKMLEAVAGSWICRADKARAELGFACEVGLEDGFRRAVAWYRACGWL